MKKIRNGLVALALAGTIFAFGCENSPITTQNKNVACPIVEDGINTRIVTITDSKDYWFNTMEKRQDNIKNQVEEIVNGGKHNIISVNTTYTDNCLSFAEIKYSVGKDCDNRNLKVIFIHNNEKHWFNTLEKRQEEIKKRLDDIVNSGKYNVQDVKIITNEEYIVAAEIYHYSK